MTATGVDLEVTREEIYGIVRNDLRDLDALAAELREAATRLARKPG